MVAFCFILCFVVHIAQKDVYVCGGGGGLFMSGSVLDKLTFVEICIDV